MTKHNDESGNQEQPEKKYLFDNPKNVKILLGCFYGSLVVLLLIEFLLHKHPHFWMGSVARILCGLRFCGLRGSGDCRQILSAAPGQKKRGLL